MNQRKCEQPPQPLLSACAHKSKRPEELYMKLNQTKENAKDILKGAHVDAALIEQTG